MNLEQAIAAMREGKIVTQSDLLGEYRIFLKIDFRVIRYTDYQGYKSNDWHLFTWSISDLIGSKFELYEEPKPDENEIKVGDYVQVKCFNDKYNWQVTCIHEMQFSVKPTEGNRSYLVSKEHCKKVPGIKIERGEISNFLGPREGLSYPIESKRHEYKVGDKVWVKASIYDGMDEEGNYGLLAYYKDCITEIDRFSSHKENIKPRGDDE